MVRIFKGIAQNYQRIAVTQILLIFFVLILGDFLTDLGVADPTKWAAGLLLCGEAVYLILLMQLAEKLNPSKTIRSGIIFSLVLVFTLSLIAINPFVEFVQNKTPWLIAVHLLLCAGECYVIVLGLKDIYLKDLHITDRLWGSVAVYLMIALGWASLYEIFVLSYPSALGVSIEAGYPSYSESLYYSLCSISGTGSVYPNPLHIVRNLSLVESIWGVLFLVMLIGRLFSLPSNEKKSV